MLLQLKRIYTYTEFSIGHDRLVHRCTMMKKKKKTIDRIQVQLCNESMRIAKIKGNFYWHKTRSIHFFCRSVADCSVFHFGISFKPVSTCISGEKKLLYLVQVLSRFTCIISSDLFSAVVTFGEEENECNSSHGNAFVIRGAKRKIVLKLHFCFFFFILHFFVFLFQYSFGQLLDFEPIVPWEFNFSFLSAKMFINHPRILIS